VDDPHPVLFSVGEVFHGKYEIRRCIKVGGMAIVYEAVHRLTRRPSALKVMQPEILFERGMRERFELEARVTAGIDDDHLVEIFDAGIDDPTGSAFLVLELLVGDDLESVLQRRGRFAEDQVVALLSQAAIALDRVHAAGIVHRDLKPSNLFLVELEGRSPHLKVLDFGIAKLVASNGLTTRNFGTPLYMSPEQVRGDGDIGAAADLYSLGQIAFTLLVGLPYWDEERASGGRVLFDSIEEGAREAASRRADKHGVRLPELFDAWFARATAVEPEARFETASALVSGLADALGVPLPSMPQPSPRLDRRASRWSARAMVMPLAALGLVVGASWASLRGFDSPEGRTPAVESISMAATPSRSASSSLSSSASAPLVGGETREQALPTTIPQAPSASTHVTASHPVPAAIKRSASPSTSVAASAGPLPEPPPSPAASSPFGTKAF
jgi:serine/threonine protein kinase